MSKIISIISFIFSFFTSATTQANNTESNMNTDNYNPSKDSSMNSSSFFIPFMIIISIFTGSAAFAYKHALTVCPTSDPFFGINFVSALTVNVTLAAIVAGVCTYAYITIKSHIRIIKVKELIMSMRTLAAVIITIAIFIPMILQVGMQQSVKAILGLAPLAFTLIDLLLNVEYHADVRELVVAKEKVADLAAHNARVRANYEAAMSKFLVILFFVLPTQAFAASTQEHSMQSNFPFIVLGIFALIAIISMGITYALEARKQRIAAAAYLAAAPEREAEELAYQQRIDAWRLEAWWKNADAASVALDNNKIMANHYASESTINGIATVNYMHTQDAVANGTGLKRASIMKIKLLLVLFFLLPSQAFAATQENIMNIELDLFPHLTADKEMGIAFLSLMIFMSFVAFFVTNNYFNNKRAQKLAAIQRILDSEREQTRRFYAAAEWERRERNADYYRQQAAEAAERVEQTRLRLIEIAAERVAKIDEERRRHLENMMKEHMHRINMLHGNINWGSNDDIIFAQKNEQDKVDALVKSILEMTNEEIWKTYDKVDQEEMTAAALAEAHQAWAESGDNTFFYNHLSIQSLRKFWLLQYEIGIWQKQLSINNWFYMVMSAMSLRMMQNDKSIHAFYRASFYNVGALANGSMQIMTKLEADAMILIAKRNQDVVSENEMQFFVNWQMPTNDAAVGGLLLAMSKDEKFAHEMHEERHNFDFWRNNAMNAEKSLWKAAQWKVYLARYKKVKALKDNMWPMFAKEEVATGKLTHDIVVGFNFVGDKHEICDVADTCSIAKILAAGYDQVLRIRRTDAKGIWNESKQINSKYTGNFCTGAGQVQEQGYYQSKFLQGHYIPWVADIMINGEWDNFGVILTNNSGVVDYGMGNNNRSKKHEQILYRMFGKGDQNEIPTNGQNMVNEMMSNWFTHRQFNINHAVAEIKQKLAAAVDNQIW